MYRASAMAGLLVLAIPAVLAQAPGSWERSASGKVSFTQAGFYRWHDGGVSSLALSLGLDGEVVRSADRWNQRHEVHLRYGLVKQDGFGVRKAEDVIHAHLSFTNQHQFLLEHLVPSLGIDVRSQFDSGYDYRNVDDAGSAPRISGFLAPATFVETVGINYEPVSYYHTRFGLAAKQTLVADRTLRPRYKVNPERAVRGELGLSLLTRIDCRLFSNVHLDHSTQFFASFNQPDQPDMLSETQITMTVNRWLQVNLEYVAKLDRDVSRSLQMKEVISLAISIALI